MDDSISKQQRTRLDCDPYLAADGRIFSRFDHLRAGGRYQENAIGLHAEIAATVSQIQRRGLPAILNQQANWRLVGVIHAGIDREGEPLLPVVCRHNGESLPGMHSYHHAPQHGQQK